MATTRKKRTDEQPEELMIVNDIPGEECRVAILQDNHLEELYTERTETATNVGNIYKGRVTNVESAIQAAFVDYGEGQNGFLHISDLHPKYFPGEEKTERVGKKIPRRQRPPIQQALRRGDEIVVQVMKEGIGTKGPTLTSYTSIPGRLVVMMPDMDRVGVSRKVEDDQQRRSMREVLDSVGLPDGFGFILRTAGVGKTKTDIKRDVAYLQRLWKAMEKRVQSRPAPCELYTESDLFIRTIRDVLRPSIKALIVDSDSAYERATAFLRVVAPRSAPQVIRYRKSTPIFHAFDVERQIELIHAREVPLPSGGAIVIDQTEALVAIDVNSGKSRRANDSETNAYQTNTEAVDEIARQLRLRDLGGLVVNDLIDMRAHRHRRAIEDRMRDNLKSDRARSTMLKISEFGIMEMTRQRMRPGISKANFVTCSHCAGRGEVKSPEYLGAYAVRHIGFLLQYSQVARVEVVCSPHVASFLLSHKRRQLVELEDASKRRIDVRVSDTIAADRVDFYAYDSRNADIAIDKLPVVPPPSLKSLDPSGGTAASAVADAAPAEQDAPEKPTRSRRRRGGRKRGESSKQTPEAPVETAETTETHRVHEVARDLGVTSREVLEVCGDEGIEVKNHMSKVTPEQVATIAPLIADGKSDEPTEPTEPSEPKKRTRRGSRGGRRRRKRSADGAAEAVTGAQAASDSAADDDGPKDTPPEDAPKEQTRSRSRRSRGRRRRDTEAEAPAAAEPASEADTESAAPEPAEDKPKKKRSRRKKKTTTAPAATNGVAEENTASDAATDEEPAKRGGRRRSRRGDGGKPATDAEQAPRSDDSAVAVAAGGEKPKPRRTLYRTRTRIGPAREQGEREE